MSTQGKKPRDEDLAHAAFLFGQAPEPMGEAPSNEELAAMYEGQLPAPRKREVESHLAANPELLARWMRMGDTMEHLETTTQHNRTPASEEQKQSFSLNNFFSFLTARPWIPGMAVLLIAATLLFEGTLRQESDSTFTQPAEIAETNARIRDEAGKTAATDGVDAETIVASSSESRRQSALAVEDVLAQKPTQAISEPAPKPQVETQNRADHGMPVGDTMHAGRLEHDSASTPLGEKATEGGAVLKESEAPLSPPVAFQLQPQEEVSASLPEPALIGGEYKADNGALVRGKNEGAVANKDKTLAMAGSKGQAERKPPQARADMSTLAPISVMQQRISPAFPAQPAPLPGRFNSAFNTENYAKIQENDFKEVMANPLSTFSIDVDTASYSNMRRFLSQNQLPPKDAVRIEEMVNYFRYDYPAPQGRDPLAIATELTQAPWHEGHLLMRVALNGKTIAIDKAPPSNLVFLLDVSGSMNNPNKLPLLKKAFHVLVNGLRPQDKVSMVVYAGASGLVLPPTSGNDKARILSALDTLQAGGSTHGSAGLKLAYETAAQSFLEEGNNRVILATDGDFNVGQSSDGELVRLIENYREQGVFLTVLGFGTGNYKDGKMESLADHGNGNYAYIDTLQEAKKVLGKEMTGTLHTIAKDVKIQVEFNPAQVQSYRLIGYENRTLAAEDFTDDKKDAGEVGAGHQITALYEIVPHGVRDPARTTPALKYQSKAGAQIAEERTEQNFAITNELATVKYRFKTPQGTRSKEASHVVMADPVAWEEAGRPTQFAAAVAGFGMLLRDSQYKGSATYDWVQTTARSATGRDEDGYRHEFVRLVETAKLLAQIEESSKNRQEIAR